ncbi:dihydrofolate reductase family protein [Galbitalea sp. SE-J8]|uniref:dihydrofolate reductase family protein n=1 Tax=Galbitalea sp. SE-J8 TaxID=3054952 RepID=UPI00259CDF7B|nr:dihydrofolate reductase family protein [Galbitalea sp. SE-J8]MDM4763212.1 dihydrofolate reductase family protein [Galbitalea sp. SE-J8]
MLITRVFPGAPEVIDVDADRAAARARLLDLYRPAALSIVRTNLITSVTGEAAGGDGTSHTLSNPVDRMILGVIRELADLVLVGAATVRAEGYLMPRRAPLAVVTASGDLTGHAFAADTAPGRLVVVCPPDAEARVRAQLAPIEPRIVVLDATAGRIDPVALVTALRVRGFESIVCEGGPALARRLLAAGVVDELCLTTSPRLGGRPPSLAADDGLDLAATLEQLLVDDGGAVYSRWTLTGPGAEAPGASV